MESFCLDSQEAMSLNNVNERLCRNLARNMTRRVRWRAGLVFLRSVNRGLRGIRCALAANAEYAVSSDRDLLALGKPFGIEIVTPVQFIKRVA